jgi:putative Mg2+ transporter-C (MgtC) family protein
MIDRAAFTRPCVASLSIAEHGQGWRQISELLLAFGLTSVIGLERQWRGKSAGLRTQAIVGTTAALMMLISKYGFTDVLAYGKIVLDPSRVAAQIVSGIGFLGAGLIITRRDSIKGLTTAASVWEAAGIGMAAGAGLGWLALVVTALHFVIVLGYLPLGVRINARARLEQSFAITYQDGRGVLRSLLAACGDHNWTVHSMAIIDQPILTRDESESRHVTVQLTLTGPSVMSATNELAAVEGVTRVDVGPDHEED